MGRGQDVGVNPGPTLFAGGLSGAFDAPWIQGPPHRYVITLYQLNSGLRTFLAATEVTGIPSEGIGNRSGGLSASVNPCIIGRDGSPCATTIQWTTADHAKDARVAVIDVGTGGSPLLLGRGKSDSATLGHIDAEPHVYAVTLYLTTSSHLITLETLTITGQVNDERRGASDE